MRRAKRGRPRFFFVRRRGAIRRPFGAASRLRRSTLRAMRSVVVGSILCAALAGCKPAETCSATIACPGGGSYQACTDGASCRLLASDGSSFTCNSCADCQAATTKAASWCTMPKGGVGGNGGADMAITSTVAQSQSCIDYLSCAAIYTPSQFPALVNTYGPDGACWKSSPAVAAGCTNACANALQAARNDPAAPPACGPSGTGVPDFAYPLPPPPDLAINYVHSTIHEIRQAGTSGSFALDGVVAIAVAPTGKRLFVEEAAGGDYSAVEVTCSPTSPTHPCTLTPTVRTIAVGDSLTLLGYYYKAPSGFEAFYLDSITDNGHAVSSPAPAPLNYIDVIKSARTPAKWFQKVTVALSDDLVMFDYSPAELTVAMAAVCPFQVGWGMVPRTGAPTLAAGQYCDPSCATTTCGASAGAQTASSASELLVGTEFYVAFTLATDCRCLAAHKDTSPGPTQAIPKTSTLAGILIFDTPPSGTGYQYLSPTSMADFPIQ
jgi:hypothetical protein